MNFGCIFIRYMFYYGRNKIIGYFKKFFVDFFIFFVVIVFKIN